LGPRSSFSPRSLAPIRSRPWPPPRPARRAAPVDRRHDVRAAAPGVDRAPVGPGAGPGPAVPPGRPPAPRRDGPRDVAGRTMIARRRPGRRAGRRADDVTVPMSMRVAAVRPGGRPAGRRDRPRLTARAQPAGQGPPGARRASPTWPVTRSGAGWPAGRPAASRKGAQERPRPGARSWTRHARKPSAMARPIGPSMSG
jgi:hypothetical protein